MSDLDVITFGCRLNALESDMIRVAAAGAARCKTIVVNTCAVTAEAERQARQAIRRARREHPGAEIIVTGCAATLTPERYAAMPEVDRILDNTAKLLAESYRTTPPRDAGVASETKGFPIGRPEQGTRARAYLQVQQGCDHRCTFCIIPFARGASRSVPLGVVAERARALVAEGFREIVLTGVDLTAYGADLPGMPPLGQLVRRLLVAVPELARLRLSSVDPAEIDEDLWRVFAEDDRLMPHLHLSLQAGDDMVLTRMKRRHRRADVRSVVDRARTLRDDVAIGADMIAGFPTETDQMFRNGMDLVAECRIGFLHVFPYSPRQGTPAARMPAVDPSVARERARRLRQAGAAILADDLQRRVGGEGDVLIESAGVGRAACYAAVAFDAPGEPGSVQRMRFSGTDGKRLIGELVA